MAPSRGTGFDGQIFFVYDREAVTKEGDPPEDAIIYFYPPSASINSRISICGQLVGVSNFLTTVLDFAPVLIKLRTEKVALLQSGKYTLAFGGSSTEPESLLLRQLNALFSVFAFYHGSFDNVQKFSKDHISFLSNMTIIWDCYLPFIRYYGDTLPAVFDPLPFLKTPKTSSGSFLKASHILQACQRRRHVLGGCILYKKSVLCTQLEPCITRRLLLFKPNQSHHPAKQVKTDINLPFGVRILHSFLTVNEYKRLTKELSRSPYHQNPSSQPIMSSKDEQEKEINSTVGERFNGLLHKSVRKRIKSESQGTSVARENRCKVKPNKRVRSKTRERVGKEQSWSSLDKEVLPSPMKHESSRSKFRESESKNEEIQTELHTDLSSTHHQNLENAPKEYEREHDKHSTAKFANELPLANEKNDKVDDENMVNGNNLTNCQEKGGLEDGTARKTCSSGADNRQNEYPCSNSESSSSDEEELTMDEVDVKDLKIVSYAEKVPGTFTREGETFSETSTSGMEPPEAVQDVCNEGFNDLIEEGVKKSDINSTGGISLNGTSVDKTSQKGFQSRSLANELYKGQKSETNPQGDVLNGHQNQPVSLGLKMEEPINGHVCEASEGNSGTLEGQYNGLLTIGKVEDGYSSRENCDPVCDKVPVSAAEAVSSRSDQGCSTAELEQNCHRGKSIATSRSEEGQRKSSSCGNPTGVDTDSLVDMSATNTIDASLRPKGCTVDSSSEILDDDASSRERGSPGSEYHDSLENLVSDGGKSDERFLEESSSGLLPDYKDLKRNDFTSNKYYSKNINLPKDKNFEKSFFKDLVDGKKDDVKAAATSSAETKASNKRQGDSNPDCLDSDVNVRHKDSRTSSELSECDATSIDSCNTRRCPGDRKSTSGDSGLCVFHEGCDNVSQAETEVDSNPGMPEDHHGDDDVQDHHGDSDVQDHHGDDVVRNHHGDDDVQDQHGDDHDALGLGASICEENLAEQTTRESGGEDHEKEVECDEEIDDNTFEVDGLVHFNLYVQAHSNTVLILLAEDQLHQDNETIKALWKTSLNELGELEVRLNQCHENPDHSLKPEDYSYLVYDGLSNTTKGNLEEPVLQVDHMFCDTAKTVHEQFNNCSSLRSVTLRNSSSAVYCQRSLAQEVYLHKKGSFKSFISSPSPRDPTFNLEKRACKLLHKNHGINVF